MPHFSFYGIENQLVTPSQEIHQGDPILSYIFVLCMEKLAHHMHQKGERGCWKPIRASTEGPTISHLFFADVLLLLAEASKDQTDVMA